MSAARRASRDLARALLSATMPAPERRPIIEITTRSSIRVKPLLICDDLVDDSVFFRILGGHEEVAVRVSLDFFHGLAGVLGEDRVHLLFYPEHFFGLDCHVARLAFGSAHDLVDQNAGVGQGI